METDSRSGFGSPSRPSSMRNWRARWARHDRDEWAWFELVIAIGARGFNRLKDHDNIFDGAGRGLNCGEERRIVGKHGEPS